MGRLYCLEVMYYEWSGGGGGGGGGRVCCQKEKRKKFKQPSPNKTKQNKLARQLTHLTSHSLTFN